jgi:hypothetical protein
MNLVATSNQETEKVDYGEPIVVWGVATFYRGTEEHPGKRQIWIRGDWQLAGPAQLKHLLQLADAGSTAAARGHQQATSCGAEAFSSWERERSCQWETIRQKRTRQDWEEREREHLH